MTSSDASIRVDRDSGSTEKAGRVRPLGSLLPRAVMLTLTCCLALVGCADPGSGSDTPTKDVSGDVKINPEAAQLVPDKYRSSGEITVGGTIGLAPMLYADSDGGTPTGLEADLLDAIGNVLDLEIRIEETKPDAYIPGILSGRYDLAAGSITDTKEREKQVNFVVHAHYGQGLLALKENEDAVSFESLCGKNVGVMKGSVQQLEFLPAIGTDCKAASKPPPTAVSFPDPNSLFLATSTERIDAGFTNEVTALYQAKQSNGEMVLADKGLGTDPKGLVVGKDTGLTKPIHEAMKVLADDGVLARIFDKWDVPEMKLPEPQVNVAHR